MPKKPKPKPDDAKQSKRFVDTARNLEVEESGKSFEHAMKIIKADKIDERHSNSKETKKSKL